MGWFNCLRSSITDFLYKIFSTQVMDLKFLISYKYFNVIPFIYFWFNKMFERGGIPRQVTVIINLPPHHLLRAPLYQKIGGIWGDCTFSEVVRQSVHVFLRLWCFLTSRFLMNKPQNKISNKIHTHHWFSPPIYYFLTWRLSTAKELCLLIFDGMYLGIVF